MYWSRGAGEAFCRVCSRVAAAARCVVASQWWKGVRFWTVWPRVLRAPSSNGVGVQGPARTRYISWKHPSVLFLPLQVLHQRPPTT